MTIAAGERDRLIEFQRLITDEDDLGQQSNPEPERIVRAWAKVLFGSGQERREAAQERASQSATFLCNWTPALAEVTQEHRISALNRIWDITSIAPIGVNDELHFTAVTSS